MALPRPVNHAEVAAKLCSYHLRAIRPRISCVTIRRRFILFDAAQFLLFVNSPLSAHAAQTTRRSPIRNRIFRAFPAPRPLMPSSRRPPARRSAVPKSTRPRPPHSQANLPRFSGPPPANAKSPPPASTTFRRPQKHPPAPFRRGRVLDQAHARKNEPGGKAWAARHAAIPWRIHVLR